MTRKLKHRTSTALQSTDLENDKKWQAQAS